MVKFDHFRNIFANFCGMIADNHYKFLNKMKQDRHKENEYKYCGNCCWFYAEDTDGWGLCGKQSLCDSMNCSDLCTNGTFISREQMRHYQAVLLQVNRYRRDDHVPSIYRMPDPRELGKAIDFAYEFIRIFSKL